MEEYYFLIVLAAVWSLFASVSDFKTREVPNWISYSLIAFALVYRAFYSLSNGWMFFFYGLIGFGLFVILGYLFYYGGAFGGGDAKLLMAFGAILPFEAYGDYLFLGLGFVFLLFLVGGIWSLGYTAYLVRGNKKFSKEFRVLVGKRKFFVYGVLVIGLLVSLASLSVGLLVSLAFLLLGLMPFLYYYAKAVDSGCMIKMKKPGELQEGDWILKDIKVGKNVIKKTVHGLTKEDIRILKKARKKIEVKDGVPFTISFFLSIMLFYVLFFLFPWMFSL